jgi:hypothetical protein
MSFQGCRYCATTAGIVRSIELPSFRDVEITRSTPSAGGGRLQLCMSPHTHVVSSAPVDVKAKSVVDQFLALLGGRGCNLHDRVERLQLPILHLFGVFRHRRLCGLRLPAPWRRIAQPTGIQIVRTARS